MTTKKIDSNKANGSSTINKKSQTRPSATMGGPTAPKPSKKLSNKNALKHGVYAMDLILSWESEQDYQELYQGFKDEWKPSGDAEEHAVLDLTHYTWLRLRLIKSANLKFFRSSVSDELKSGAVTWDEMIRHEAAVPKHAVAAIHTAKGMIENLDGTFEVIRAQPYWTEDSEGKEVQQKLSRLQYDVSNLKEEVKTKVVKGMENLVDTVRESKARFDQAYDLDEMEKQLNLMAKLDRCIEKTLRRLTSIKVFKRTDGVEPPIRVLPDAPRLVPDDATQIDMSNTVDDGVRKDCDTDRQNPAAEAAPEADANGTETG
jgi:hypothetical protein